MLIPQLYWMDSQILVYQGFFKGIVYIRIPQFANLQPKSSNCPTKLAHPFFGAIGRSDGTNDLNFQVFPKFDCFFAGCFDRKLTMIRSAKHSILIDITTLINIDRS